MMVRVLSLSILSILLLASPIASGNQPSTSTCAGAIVVRGSGQVLIDNWITYSIAPGLPPAMRSVTPDLGPQNNPTSVTFGKTLQDSMKVCIEGSDGGTKCVDLKAVKTLIK